MRLWLNNNRSNSKDIELVINLALDELITSSSESTITLDVLKDLSYQLPYIKDLETRRSTLNRFKIIENDVQDSELSKNKYIYKLNVFHAIFTINRHESIDCINKILKEIESIDDTLVKLESFSEVYSKLTLMMKQYDFKDKINFAYSRILSLSSTIYFNCKSL